VKRKIVYNLANNIPLRVKESINYPIPEVSEVLINLSQLQRNFEIIKSLIKPNTKFMAVLKGDSCGHGMINIAKELLNYKCDAFGVVRLIEAFTLRKAGTGIPIMMLAPILPSQASWIIKYDITPMVDNEEIIQALEKYASKYNKTVNVHVKINTGLNRYGIMPEKAVDFIHKIREEYSHLIVEGVYTHFQDPDYNPEFTYTQIKYFDKIINQLEQENLRPKIVHAAGSAGIIKYPESHYDMVRCGILLYGLEHEQGEKKIPEGIKPLTTLKGRIIKIQTIKAGQAGGYGNRFIAKKDSRVAIIGLGYGDGVSRGWKEVLIAGKRVPVVNYFMDSLMVDISALGQTVRELDEAVIIGSLGSENISWLEACKHLGSYSEELIQRITERVPRNYFYE
jgi:alanine racemase